MLPRNNQPDTGRLVSRCLRAWMVGALLVALLIPSLPAYHYGFSSGAYGIGASPAGRIPFGSPTHLILGLSLVLVVAPVAGLLTAFFLLKMRGVDPRSE
jgi:hypothetical protein